MAVDVLQIVDPHSWVSQLDHGLFEGFPFDGTHTHLPEAGEVKDDEITRGAGQPLTANRLLHSVLVTTSDEVRMLTAFEAANIIHDDYTGRLIYEPGARHVDDRGCQATGVTYRAQDGREYGVLVVRGSDEAIDWIRNFLIVPCPSKGARYWWHAGFLRHARMVFGFACGLSRCDVAVGHSLGGAVVQILSVSLGIPGIAIGAPRVYVGGTPPTAPTRIYNRSDDPVTKVPSWAKHVGRVKVIDPLPGQSVFGKRHRIIHYTSLLKGID